MSTIAVIGAGFSGLSAAAYLSDAGHEVHVFEKNSSPGGRARRLITPNGYVFDMGPSWYWMPDIFEKFFNDFGYSATELYNLKLLDPAFEMVFSKGKSMRIPADTAALGKIFESIESGSKAKLEEFLRDAQFKYELSMRDLVFKPGLSFSEYAYAGLIAAAFRKRFFYPFSKHVRKYFSHPHLIALMEFPVIFLGGMLQDVPALYSLMNYAGLKLGTWYPMGGFGRIIDAMVRVAAEKGTQFHYNAPVEKIEVRDDEARGIFINGQRIEVDAVLASADYHHVENELLAATHRNYREAYWERKTFAPSCLIYFLGISKKIDSLQHHTLFFDEDLHEHNREIYEDPKWPTKPLFYVCCPSRTDPGVAPEGHENLFFLMPIASGLEDKTALREKFFELMIQRFQRHIGQEISPYIDFRESYCISDFESQYNAYKGNAYGLANTTFQTAVFKPKMRNRKVSNLFYAGQLTVPGPGVPPSLISGKIAAGQLLGHLKKIGHEVVI